MQDQTSRLDVDSMDQEDSIQDTRPALDITRKDLITATAASTCIACFLMGVLANLPFAVSTGLGINAYFTFNVVGACKSLCQAACISQYTLFALNTLYMQTLSRATSGNRRSLYSYSTVSIHFHPLQQLASEVLICMLEALNLLKVYLLILNLFLMT